jgi:predicted Zn-dependent protease
VAPGGTAAPWGLERTPPGLAILWVPTALLPIANVLYLGPVLVAERTLYLASWGVAVLGAWMLISLAERRGPRPLWLLGVLAVAGAARTATRVPVWNDTESVMGALIEDHPESGTGWMNLGRQLAAQGRQEDALTAFTYAVVFLNSGYRPSTELAAHLTAMNRPAAARFFLMRAWREHPEWYTALGLLAAELRAGRPEKAAPAARAAAFLQPSNPSMHHLLAQSLAGLEAWDGAVDARPRSLRTGFSDRGRSWLLLANDQASRGDTLAALAALDSASTRDLTDGERATLFELSDALARPRPEPRE